jgi:threonine/homoserine/homoserine lactone efflux protein
MIPHFLDSQLTDGSVVSRALPSTNIFWYSFLLEAVNPKATVWLEGLEKLKKFNEIIGESNP